MTENFDISPALSFAISKDGNELPALVRQALNSSKAINTKRAYFSDWLSWQTWCNKNRVNDLPADPVKLSEFLTEQAQSLKISTVQRRAAAVGQFHQLKGYESPTSHPLVKTVLQGLRRQFGMTIKSAPAIITEKLREMLLCCQRDKNVALGQRDRALLLIGFAGCFRRSELVALNVENITWATKGVEILLTRSKTDQESHGKIKKIPHGVSSLTCPVRALKEWLESADIFSGPIFRSINRHGKISSQRLSDKAVARVVSARAKQAGLEKASFSAHSLRSGFATTAAEGGATVPAIMEQGGWKSTRVALGYVKRREDWENCAVYKAGL